MEFKEFLEIYSNLDNDARVYFAESLKELKSHLDPFEGDYISHDTTPMPCPDAPLRCR